MEQQSSLKKSGELKQEKKKNPICTRLVHLCLAAILNGWSVYSYCLMQSDPSSNIHLNRTNNKMFEKKKKLNNVGEMAQRLKAVVVLPEEVGSIPSTHMMADSHL